MVDLIRFAQRIIGVSRSLSRPLSLLRPLTLAGAVLASLVIYTGAAVAQSASRTANGMTAYLGLLPSAIVSQSSRGHAVETAHGGVSRRDDSYHLVIALYDSRTKQRIEDGRVRARVAGLGLGGIEKELEPMNIAGTITYGNYFDLQSPGIYRITVTVQREGKTVRFQFEQRR